jgi:hypothetical protein
MTVNAKTIINVNNLFRVTTGGNVGIGSVNPTSKLSIMGNVLASSSGNVDFTLRSSTTNGAANNDDAKFIFRTGSSSERFDILNGAGSKLFTIASNGNVGVGTVVPSELLQVEKNQNASTRILISNQQAANTGVDTSLKFSLIDATADIGLFSSANTANTYLQDKLVIRGQSDTAGVLINASSTAGNIRFATAGTATQFERMIIASTGNVGIGTTSPGTLLSVQKNSQTGGLGSIVIGANYNSASSLTNNVEKQSALTSVPYTNGQAPVTLIGGDSDGTSNYVLIGGNMNALQAATNIQFSTSTTLNDTTGGTARMIINKNGLIGMNTTPGSATLSITAYTGISSPGALRATATETDGVGVEGHSTLNTTHGYPAYFVNDGASNGQFLTNTGAWQSISDQRLKTDIKILDVLDRLRQITPRDFLWRSQIATGDTRRNFGFIAQEVQAIFPDLVTTSPSGYFGVNYEGFISPLVEGWQNHDQRILQLEQGQASQSASFENLRAQTASLSLTVDSLLHPAMTSGSLDPLAVLATTNGQGFSLATLFDFVLEQFQRIGVVFGNGTIAATKVTGQEICAGGACVNESQLNQLIQQANIASPTPTPSATPTPDPSVSPTPDLSITPAPSDAPTPSPSDTPTPSDTPAPSDTPSP